MKYLLDTHTWIWWNARPEALSPKVRRILSRADAWEALLLSPISVWELGRLLDEGRIGLSCPPPDWIAKALEMPGLRLAPLTPSVAYQATVLPEPFHQDPADRIIAATAREERATILTSDPRLLSYRHVQAIW